MPLTFNAITVEAANPDRSSICQLGIIHVENGIEVDRWQTLVNPEDWFDEFFSSEIHGISEYDVEGKPTLPQIGDELRRRLSGAVLISHRGFDRVTFERAMNRHDLEQLEVTWLDSAKVARRAWFERFGRRGYGLKVLAGNLGIVYRDHEAGADARAAALVILQARDDTSIDIEGWLERVKRQVVPSSISNSDTCVSRDAESDEYTVFTGALSRPGRELAIYGANAGLNVIDSVTNDTNILVVGVRNIDKLDTYEKSATHLTAENQILGGQDIQILHESAFFDLISIAP